MKRPTIKTSAKPPTMVGVQKIKEAVKTVVEAKSMPLRPDSIALLNAIEGIIDDIAVGKMTPIEVLGVLDWAGKEFFANHREDT